MIERRDAITIANGVDFIFNLDWHANAARRKYPTTINTKRCGLSVGAGTITYVVARGRMPKSVYLYVISNYELAVCSV